MELWLNRNVVNADQIDVRVSAAGYDNFSLRTDHSIDEVASEALGERFSLALLRELLTRELAEAVSADLGVPYRE